MLNIKISNTFPVELFLNIFEDEWCVEIGLDCAPNDKLEEDAKELDGDRYCEDAFYLTVDIGSKNENLVSVSYGSQIGYDITDMEIFYAPKLVEIVKKYVATNDEDGLAKEIAGMQFEAREY